MKTKREIAVRQIELQHEIQSHGINIINCCCCGSVLLYKLSERKLDCLCGERIDPNDCGDYWYTGAENSSEFNQA